jgi:putative transposase
VAATWPLTVVQTSVLHLIRNTFRLASRADWDSMGKDLRPVYTAPTEAAAKERFVEFCDKWADRYPAVRNLWEDAWTSSCPSSTTAQKSDESSTPV